MEEKENCCTKTTHRTPEEQKRLMNRLSRIEGQIRGIKNMVANDAYCTDILTQCSAASAALNSFNKDLIKHHIKGCVLENLEAGNTEIIDELVSTVQKLMK